MKDIEREGGFIAIGSHLLAIDSIIALESTTHHTNVYLKGVEGALSIDMTGIKEDPLLVQVMDAIKGVKMNKKINAKGKEKA